MNDGANELLNQLRTKAVGKNRDKNLLSIADSLEELIHNQTSELGQIHEQLSEAHAEITTVKSELELQLQKNYLIQERLRIELARRFGRSSEKWKPLQKVQAELFNESEYISANDGDEQADDDKKDSAAKRNIIPKDSAKPVKRGGRTPLPADLPRKVVRIELSEEDKHCDVCHELMPQIGEEIGEQLQMRPIEFYVEQTIRTVHTCKKDCGCLKSAPVPNQIYPKSILGETVISQIIVSKFCDALPFNRQETMLLRSNIKISSQTMVRASAQAAKILTPLNNLINKLILRGLVIYADETRVRVLNERGIKKDGNSWMWVLASEYMGIKLVRFHYASSRGKEVAFELLDDFNGILMTDGYAAYNGPSQIKKITQAACMAHVRRKFHDVIKGDHKNPHASGI